MKRILPVVVVVLGMFAVGQPAWAGSVENLERERAILIKTLFDASISPEDRAKKVTVSQRRLVDLERIVMRDPSLEGKTSPVVRRAFENYDLTFLVHAATENNVSTMDQWMEQTGLSTAALMGARIGRR